MDCLQRAVQDHKHPQLKSGLLLAGAFRYLKGDVDRDCPGVLTSFVISGWDLRRTEFVGLSACVSGKGDELGGQWQGVAGLGRAVQTAGARSVLMTLWKVDDEMTKVFMIRFYRLVFAEGRDRALALRAAQRHVMRTARDERKPAALAFGAFVLYGAFGTITCASGHAGHPPASGADRP